MSKLTTHQKELIIQLLLKQHSNDPFKNKKNENKLLLTLGIRESQTESKWQAIEDYLNNPENKNTRLGRILASIIQSAEKAKSDEIPLSEDEEKYLNYLSPVFKEEIINKLAKEESNEFHLFELIDKLKNVSPSINERWQALMEFLKYKSNRNSPSIKKLLQLLKSHNVDDDHLYYAKEYFQKGQTDSNAYRTALEYLNKINKKSAEIYGAMGECAFELGDNLKAYEYFLNACKTNDVEVQNKYMGKQLQTLDRILKAGRYINFGTDELHWKNTYNWKHFGESPSKWALNSGIIPACCLLRTGASAFELGLPLILLSLPFLLVVGPLGLLAGSIHGFFRSVSRHPLDADQQIKLFENLTKIANSNDGVKISLIEQIIDKYTSARTISHSNSSTNLFAKLLENNYTIEEKWQFVEGYLLEKENSYFKNNGKKLFCIIDNVINEHLKSESNVHDGCKL